MRLDPQAFKGLARFLAPSAGGSVADRALAEGLITPGQFEEVLREQERSGRPLDEILVGRGILRPEDADRLRGPEIPPEAAEAAADPGRRIGHYVRVAPLGTGGMAEVWKAWDASLGRWVALKLLKPGTETQTRRLEREGRLAGGLSHPNIISIFEQGFHEGRPYLVMPYVDGRPPRSPLDPREAARIALEVARALAYAHRQGIIHRDVKPGNILIDAGGRPVLTDFGLAVPQGAASPQGWTLSGTPEYASPEQLRGGPVDARTDIYSLGATLCHFLTGRHPFEGPGVSQVVRQVLEGPSPPMENVPRRLARIVRKAMERDAARRYGRMEEMARDLEAFLGRGGRPLPGWWGTLGAAAVLILLSSAVTYFVVSRSGARQREQAIREALEEGWEELARVEEIRRERGRDSAELRASARRAVRAFNRAMNRAGEDHPEACEGLGRCYEITGPEVWAEEYYRRAGDRPRARVGLAWIWLRRDLEGRKDRDWRSSAIGLLEGMDDPGARVLRQFAERRWAEVLESGLAIPEEGRRGLILGISAAALGRWEEALVHLDRAWAVDRDDPLVFYHKGLVLASKGEKGEAAEVLERAVRKAAPDWPLREEASRRAAELRR